MSEPICLCPAASEYDPPCPKHGVLGIGVTGTTVTESASTEEDDAASLYARALKKIAETNDYSSSSAVDAIAATLADEKTLRNWLRSHGHGIALDVGRKGVNVAIELLSEAAGSFSLLSRSPHASYHAGPWAQRVARDPADHARTESLCRHGVIPYPWGCASLSTPISEPDIYMPWSASRTGGAR